MSRALGSEALASPGRVKRSGHRSARARFFASNSGEKTFSGVDEKFGAEAIPFFRLSFRSLGENLRRKKVAASSSLLASSASAARETARAPAKAYL